MLFPEVFEPPVIYNIKYEQVQFPKILQVASNCLTQDVDSHLYYCSILAGPVTVNWDFGTFFLSYQKNFTR